MTPQAPWQRAASGAMLLDAAGRLAPTIFAEMSALATATDSINLGQGYPDDDGPVEVLEAAHEALRSGLNQYPPGRGMPVLLDAVAAHQRRFYGIDLDPRREVLVTAGATEALAATILAFVDRGDEVVTLEPFYDAYGAVIGLAGGVHVTVPLRGPDSVVDPDELRRAFGPRTRLVVLNDPHNPTGSVLDDATRRLLLELAVEHDALVVTDEVYEHLLFDGAAHVPFATLPGAAARTISISSGGKTFNTTGWKIGWLTGPAELVDRIVAVKQYLTFVNGSVFQPAIAVGLGLPDAYFDGIARTLAHKRDVLSDGLRRAGFAVRASRGSYFVVADAAPLGFDDAAELCRRLPESVGVVGLPISAFCHPALAAEQSSLVRFAFCKRVEVLEQAAARLASLSV
ncbi:MULTISPECIES: aminotransferase class I/II-fold pyridoxal phosphate-dependent enzyme [unclassified Frigoribacterium]|uniref:aminotransferase class I/II-fold pyridoxal phosphate-dependent enzyme n=1 Tax=unclassified Frigoribacterium TaxID=2627005 RepID=UPI00156307A6|nr:MULTISPECIES: aminotransferase class I/II-fold pyridoxal phosphate-dependent enzyme [unclassified Frigoribacterium]NQW88401.1 aminotransferase class I/II-fold pyridoxal phosphate-dependent enzyme [Frigoribacterium sp. VKM Ac-2860]NQX08790.1 aminotransferase class I/II-fold pyridoxal phosphate-dependent enzyme [Frigoribacterium sp. VKM Ac-2859]